MMLHIMFSRFHGYTFSLLALTLTVGACGQPIDPVAGNFGGSETGGYEQGPMAPGECIFTEPQEGVYGYKHQCNGAYIASIGGLYNEQEFLFYIPQADINPFGDGHEPYEQTKVMACCGEYDSEQEEYWPTYASNCMSDFRQQACRSLAAGLETRINDGTVPVAVKGKAVEIQKWIALRTTECMDALEAEDEFGAPDWLGSTWDLPNNGPWAPDVSDVYLTIYWAEIEDVYLPEEPEICHSLHDNDTNVFTDQSSTPLINAYPVELDEADGDLLGPIYGAGRINGSGDFASLSTSCSDPFCSTASFSVGSSSDFAIDSMVLYADGPLVVTNGTLAETVTDVRIELYEQALGFATCVTSCTYTVLAGDAHFVVVGVNGGDDATLALPNSTNITATVSGGVWSLDPFEIEYVDDLSETWTLTVNSSEWL